MICGMKLRIHSQTSMVTGDPLHSRALAHSRAPLFTQPCPHCSHSSTPGEQWAGQCVFTLQGCVQAAQLCRGSPVMVQPLKFEMDKQFHSTHYNGYYLNGFKSLLHTWNGPNRLHTFSYLLYTMFLLSTNLYIILYRITHLYFPWTCFFYLFIYMNMDVCIYVYKHV